MEAQEVIQHIKNHYTIEVQKIEKIKNVYKIYGKDDVYCLKVIKYNFPHFLFIISAIRHLQGNGFEKVPSFISTKDGESYIKLENNYAYLTLWIHARECNYDNPLDVKVAAKKLSELHKCSENFNVTMEMKPRIGWLKWFKIFSTRIDEIYDFKRRINEKDKLTEFDELYIDMMEEEIERGKQSLKNLGESNYIFKMKEEIGKRGFCHHDYAHHNVLISANKEVNIIDFDYCMLDTHLHDLSSLLIRVMKNGRWDIMKGEFIINSYNEINRVVQDDIPVMAAFMEFPQEYWQVGIQYYWEKQAWGEEFFLKKLKKIQEDKYDREEFIEVFRTMKYNGG